MRPGSYLACLATPLAALLSLGPLAPLTPPPASLDAALFGPLGALGALALVAPGGPTLVGALPLGGGAQAPTPAAAPAHVLALLGAGVTDGGANLPSPPWGGAGAVVLGGLWSRRLGPHRAIWAWDIVELAAVDLFMAEASGDHAWAGGGAGRGALWGGGGVRLFRIGLAASHHHLSATGLAAPGGDLGGAYAYAAPALAPFVAPLVARPLPPTPPLLAPPAPGRGGASGPWAPSEGALGAWSLALLAPSGGALAAWGVWLAPLYTWAALGALAAAFRWPQAGAPGPQGAHAPLAPLAHALGGGLPWAPAAPRPRCREMPNQLVCFRT